VEKGREGQERKKGVEGYKGGMKDGRKQRGERQKKGG
jgi:hypothetical protein